MYSTCHGNASLTAAMGEDRVRVRANRRTGELEIEGRADLVESWWFKLWPEFTSRQKSVGELSADSEFADEIDRNTENPQVFGEFYSSFRSDITDVDRVLVAGAFVQEKDPDRVFATKAANQLLLDQNTKVSNASECVRRLLHGKRVFVVANGKFRVSASGFEHLDTLRLGK